ncbi:hypothetical protein ACHQM5_006928 [Ranunculus cassubicifolius]
MASSSKTLTFAALVMIILLLQQECSLTSARKTPRSHARKMPRGSSRKHIHAPAMAYVINPYKKAQTDAFRPTSPGPSPGVGNHRPPGRV